MKLKPGNLYNVTIATVKWWDHEPRFKVEYYDVLPFSSYLRYCPFCMDSKDVHNEPEPMLLLSEKEAPHYEGTKTVVLSFLWKDLIFYTWAYASNLEMWISPIT